MQIRHPENELFASRENEFTSLRSKRRSDALASRRLVKVEDDKDVFAQDYAQNKPSIATLLDHLEAAKSSDQQVFFVKYISFVVSFDHNSVSSIDTVARIVSVMLRFLTVPNQPEPVLSNVFVTFANISSLKKPLITPLLTSGFCEVCIYHLSHTSNLTVVRMCFWCFSNFFAEGSAFIDQFLHNNFIQVIEDVVHKFGHVTEFKREYAWFFCNFCRYSDVRYLPVVKELFPLDILKTCTKPEVLHDVLWGVFFLSLHVQAFTLFKELNLFALITPLLRREWIVQLPIVKTISHYSSEPEQFLVPFLENDVLKYFQEILTRSTNEEVLHDVCFTVSNFFTNEFLLNMTVKAGIVQAMLEIRPKTTEFVRNEIRWALVHFISTANPHHLVFALQFDQFFLALADFYIQNDRLATYYVLGVLKLCIYIDEIIVSPEQRDEIFERLQQAGVVKCLEMFASSPDQKTRETTTSILKLYFSLTDVDCA